MQIMLVEPAIVPDTFASGLAEAEDLGDGNFRLTYYVKHKSMHDYGATENIVVARIVLPASAVFSAREMMTSLFGCYCGCERHVMLAH